MPTGATAAVKKSQGNGSVPIVSHLHTKKISTDKKEVVVVPNAPSNLTATQGKQNVSEKTAQKVLSLDAVKAEKLKKERAAVDAMRKLVWGGGIDDYYAVIIGATEDIEDDLDDDEIAAMKKRAMAIFEALPKLDASTTADDLVRLGIWKSKPKGADNLKTAPRYMPGRRVLVKIPVDDQLYETGKWKRLDNDTFLAYKKGGRKAITYRAVLVGEKGDNFLVKVDGKKEPIAVAKKEVIALNHPHLFPGAKPRISVSVDYNDPLMKAKVIEAALKMDIRGHVKKLDFSKRSDQMTKDQSRTLFSTQRSMVYLVYSVVDMEYPGTSMANEEGRVSHGGSGRQAIRGIGSCFKQAGTTLAVLIPMANAIGIDLQFISGGIYRYAQKGRPAPFSSSGHGWLQITYRPSGTMRVLDRTWNQPNHRLDVAYSASGDRYPGSFAYDNIAPLKPTDINMKVKAPIIDEDLDADLLKKIIDKHGIGRENHQSKIGGQKHLERKRSTKPNS